MGTLLNGPWCCDDDLASGVSYLSCTMDVCVECDSTGDCAHYSEYSSVAPSTWFPENVSIPIEWLYAMGALLLILLAVNFVCIMRRAASCRATKSKEYAAVKVYESEDQNERIAIAQ